MVSFDRSEGGFRALVHLAGAKPGERELTDTGPNCAPLTQAVAITLILLADRGPEAQTLPQSTSAPDLSTRATPSWRAARVFLASGAGLGLVGAPSLDAAAGLSVVRSSGWGLVGALFYVVPRGTSLPPGEVRVWLVAAEAEVCRAIGDVGGTLLLVCAGGAAGWLTGRGVGYPTERAAGFPWLAGSARIGLGGALVGRVRWTLQAELLVPIRRQTFSIDNLGPAWESRPVGGRVDLGAEVSLW
jgi:hypothetical protein